MPADRITFSETGKDNLLKIVRRFKLGSNHDYIAARLALARSLASEINVGIPTGVHTNKSIPLTTLTRNYEPLYRGLIEERYQRTLSDEQYSDYLIAHIEHGLALMLQETEVEDADDYLVRLANQGLTKFSAPLSGSIQAFPKKMEGYTQVLNIQLGHDTETKENVSINWNKTDEHPNNHMAIVGKPGSGKTFAVKGILEQIRKRSGNMINFLCFDYAKGDIASDSAFIAATGATVMSVPRQPLPFNPLWMSEVTEVHKKMNARRFADIIRDFEPNIGPKQSGNLYDVIVRLYQNSGDRFPDLYDVQRELSNYYEENGLKSDSLTQVFKTITDFEVFDKSERSEKTSLFSNTYVVDVSQLSATRELTVFLILDLLYRQLISQDESSVDPESQAREMRTVIVIDEAHHYLRDKKRSRILQTMIRELRSKGACVILLSQSPDDYDQQEFDFLEMLEFVLILQSSAQSAHALLGAFGIRKDKAAALLPKLATLARGEAFMKSERNSEKPYRRVLLQTRV